MKALLLFRRSLTGCVGLWLITLTVTYVYLTNGLVREEGVTDMSESGPPAEYEDEEISVTPPPNLVPPLALPEMVLSSPRLAEYCNHPSKEVTGQEGEVPFRYKLLSVHVVIRHGDRTSMYGFNNHPNPIIPCNMDLKALSHHPKLRSFIPTMYAYLGKQRPNSGFKNWALYPAREQCRSAELTGLGVLQHILLGDHLNKRYIHKWQLFNGRYSPKQLHIRCTDFSRTYQSAIAFLYGFLPQFNLTELDIQRSSSVYFCDSRYAKVPCSCPAIMKLRQSQGIQSNSRKNSVVYRDLANHIAGVYDLKRSQLLWDTAMLDVFMGQVCHDVELKCNSEELCISQDTVENLWKIVDEGAKLDASKDTKKVSEKLGRVQMHPLMVEIASRMKNLTQRSPGTPRFVLYSGHDTTVTPLAVALGFHDGHWPPYASRIVFEQYIRKTEKNPRYFIRVLFNGKDVTRNVRFCQSYQRDGLCELKHFLNFVKRENLYSLRVETYEEACRP